MAARLRDPRGDRAADASTGMDLGNATALGDPVIDELLASTPA